MKRGRGRPKLAKDERLSERLEVRADRVDKEAFEKAADIAGMKLSDWTRERLRTAAKKEGGYQ